LVAVVAAVVDSVVEDLAIGVVLAAEADSMAVALAEVGNQPAFPLGIF